MPNEILSDAINAVCRGEELAEDEAAGVLREVMEGRASPEETAGLLIALRTRGETADEIAGLARTMRELATKVEVDIDGLVDTAGTGGGTPTFNVSTTAAFVAAGRRLPGGQARQPLGHLAVRVGRRARGARARASTSRPEQVADCIENVGFGFMFAPQHHAAMKHVVPVRKALGVRTIFNLLGPLTNPADAPHQVIGVSDGPFLEHMAMALARLGGRSALVVSSEDGLDEISISAPTRVVELRDGKVETYTVTPEDLGVERAPIDAIAFGAPEENARITRAVLSGADTGPALSLTLVNAGAAVYAAGRADTLAGRRGRRGRARSSRAPPTT